jgi:RNA polymerase sigma factor (sigma-70 family)
MRMIAASPGDSLESGEQVTTQLAGTHLFEAARRGDRRAREQLVAEHLPAVRSIALRYRNLGVSVDDLMQEGALGLLEAIDRFEPARSSDFESYARFRIRRAIRNALTEQSRLIRLPKQIVERRRAIERAEANIKSAAGRTPTTAELAAATGLSPAAVVSARTLGTTPVSLDQPVLDDGSTLEALVSDVSARSPEDETVEHEQAREVDDAVDSLPGRQRTIVSRHFGLGCEPEQIAEVAAELHVSQQRARAIERDALYALREQLEPDVTPRPTR